MPISKQLVYGDIDSLELDPQNPRIGRRARREGKTQTELLRIMSKWTLEELVDSFLGAGGFWTQDALVAIVSENAQSFVVIEGNRRLAALKLMRKAIRGEGDPPRWLRERLAGVSLQADDPLFTEVPYLIADDRASIDAYLGFRHVSGIKEWAPAEKAEFIAHLIDDNDLSYREVARQIGSRADVVRQNYIAFRILIQMEDDPEMRVWGDVEDRFSVLFLSLRSSGVRDFLGIDLKAQVPVGRDPIGPEHRDQVKEFVRWLFGPEKGRVVRDSRQVDKFGEILAEPRAIEYLRRAPEPSFEQAYAFTRASADLVIDPLREASRQVRLALQSLPGREDDERVMEDAWPVTEGGVELAIRFNGQYLARTREALDAA